MARKSSNSSSPVGIYLDRPNKKKPKVFVISSDEKYLEKVFKQCRDIPPDYKRLPSVLDLSEELALEDRVDLTFALIVARDGGNVDAPTLRTCKLSYPQLFFVMMLEVCDQRTLLRLQSIGVQNILLPPFANVSLSREIATALPNVPQFKRHPDLMKRGQLRMDFIIPSDLSYVLGMNYVISMLLKEFGFPPVDSRINVPLACDEAITNAILHGNKNDPSRKVNVQIYMSHSRFKVRVSDQGDGFDLNDLKDPRADENLLRSSGRGIYLMKSIMDKVEFKDEGRVVEMERKNGSTAKG